MKTITANKWNEFSVKERKLFTGIVKYNSGTIQYFLNGKEHREDGPAVEDNGYKEWLINGKLHRLDGPAIIHPNGTEYYFIGGKHCTKLDWIKQTEQFQDILKYKNL